MPLVLVVVSRPTVSTTIQGALQGAGYETEVVAAGRRALAYLEASQPDLVILDWSLSDMAGFDLSIQLRRRVSDALPVLALGDGNSEVEAVTSLEAGADCFLPAPVQPNLLLAQVKAMLRRSNRQQGPPTNGEYRLSSQLRHEGLVIDLASHTVLLHGRSLNLTPAEFQLLALLVRQPGRLFSRSDVLKIIWQDHYFPGDRSVDNIVLRLRRKLGDCGHMIETVWGLGYRLSSSACRTDLAPVTTTTISDHVI